MNRMLFYWRKEKNKREVQNGGPVGEKKKTLALSIESHNFQLIKKKKNTQQP